MPGVPLRVRGSAAAATGMICAMNVAVVSRAFCVVKSGRQRCQNRHARLTRQLLSPAVSARTRAFPAPSAFHASAGDGIRPPSSLSGFVTGAAAFLVAGCAHGTRGRHMATRAAAASGKAETNKLQSKIEEIVALKPVVVFSKTTCPFCAQAKQALFDAGPADCITIIEIDKLDSEVGLEIQQIMGRVTGASTVPRVFVGRKFVGGGTETVELAAAGVLGKLVSAALDQTKSELRGEQQVSFEKEDQEWASLLNPSAYRVLRKRGTEPPNSHEYNTFLPQKGHFGCGACHLPLYSASSKYASTCGWPVFDSCYYSNDMGCHVGTRNDGSGSLEIFCPRCNSHLGHVFFDTFSETNLNGERH
eukprot:TRINITY_DN44451_c0_g1_i1.p1 TRINITY_DN44451_c0_g1~~TRINITY_DN44451_c0_g1_i1.p1  ORF type:complete len:394 (+),score=36.35 TRINITY_DN44451_c0_g1_i1:101-1183(+)